jgi:hypothetical protein
MANKNPWIDKHLKHRTSSNKFDTHFKYVCQTHRVFEELGQAWYSGAAAVGIVGGITTLAKKAKKNKKERTNRLDPNDRLEID